MALEKPKNYTKRLTHYRVYKNDTFFVTFENEEEAENYAEAVGAVDVVKFTFYRAYRFTPKKRMAGLVEKPKNERKPKVEELYNITTYDFKKKEDAEECANAVRYKFIGGKSNEK